MLDDKRNGLAASAIDYSDRRDDTALKALCLAATEYADARRAAAQPSDKGHTIPFGKSKGTPISAATKRDLEWVAGALERSIEDPERAKWKASNAALLGAIHAELARR